MIERHIEAGERHVTEQLCRIRLQERLGQDASFSRSLLENLEESLRLHREHRDLVLREAASGDQA